MIDKVIKELEKLFPSEYVIIYRINPDYEDMIDIFIEDVRSYPSRIHLALNGNQLKILCLTGDNDSLFYDMDLIESCIKDIEKNL